MHRMVAQYLHNTYRLGQARMLEYAGFMTVRREIAAPAFLVKRPLTGSGCRDPVKGRIRVSKESSMLNSR